MLMSRCISTAFMEGMISSIAKVMRTGRYPINVVIEQRGLLPTPPIWNMGESACLKEEAR